MFAQLCLFSLPSRYSLQVPLVNDFYCLAYGKLRTAHKLSPGASCSHPTLCGCRSLGTRALLWVPEMWCSALTGCQMSARIFPIEENLEQGFEISQYIFNSFRVNKKIMKLVQRILIYSTLWFPLLVASYIWFVTTKEKVLVNYC